MSDDFKLEVVNPEKSFLSKEDVTEVVLPAFEGEMGILKDHISIISFLKPGIIKIISKSGEGNYYVEDGIVEFKDNNLSVLTSSIFNIQDIEKTKVQELLKLAEDESSKPDINDQSKYLVEQKIEVVNPEKSFLSKEDVTEVVVPAFEGEMGILKDHISIISFLKPGIIKIFSKSGEENYYVEDGIVEFKDNNLSVLTSSIFNIQDVDKTKIQDLLKLAEEESDKSDINDQSKYLVEQKIEVLRSLN